MVEPYPQRFPLSGLAWPSVPSDLPWQTTSVRGVEWVPLAADPPTDLTAEGPAALVRPGGKVLIRMAPGVGYPAHRHLGPEDVLVLAGGFRDGRGEYRAGETLRYPAGSSHAPVALGDPDRPAGPENPACLLYVTLQRGIVLVGRD